MMLTRSFFSERPAGDERAHAARPELVAAPREVDAVVAVVLVGVRARVDPAHAEVREDRTLRLGAPVVARRDERRPLGVGGRRAEPHYLLRARRAGLAVDPREVSAVPRLGAHEIVPAERDDHDLGPAVRDEEPAQISLRPEARRRPP